MADVFLSYKRTDRDKAEQVVKLLENEKLTVWWDHRMVGGRRWDETIEREINAARCVIVIWSPHSIDSSKAYWVHLEAHHGRERGILVPVIFDGVQQPFAFSLIQERNLTDWDGASRTNEAYSLIDDVKAIIAGNYHAEQPQPIAEKAASLLTKEAEEEWTNLKLDSCKDPGLLIAYAGKWEKSAPTLADKARERAKAFQLMIDLRGQKVGGGTNARRKANIILGNADCECRKHSNVESYENDQYSLIFLDAIENAASVALASLRYIKQHHKVSQSFSADVVRQIYYPNSYVFLFREGTSVTNIQYAELYSLLKDAVKSKEPASKGCLIFHSAKELRKDIESLWYSSVCQLNSFSKYCNLIREEKSSKRDLLRYFKMSVSDIKSIYEASYKKQTMHTILIEPFANSCCVALPLGLELDINFIVSQSGYIHSCGKTIYIRSFPKADVSELVSNLTRVHKGIVDKYASGTRKTAPVKFCISSHKDSLDRDYAAMENFRHPTLNNVKLHRHKNFIGDTPIADLAEAMNIINPEIFHKYFFISSYATPNQGIQYYNNQYCDYERLPCTVFLIKDNSIGFDAQPTSNQYYLCYLQTIKNENPFIQFDDDKPAWLNPLTTPHSLACAMINLARRALSFSRKSPILLWDPFCATGTIPMEAAKIGGDVTVVASDKLEAAGCAAFDNLAVYASLCQAPHDQVPHQKDQPGLDAPSMEALIALLSSIDLSNGFQHIDRGFANTKLADTEPVSRILYWAFLNIRDVIESAINRTPKTHRDKPVAIFSNLRTMRGFDIFSHQNFKYLVERDNFQRYWIHRFIIYLVWRSALANIGEFIRHDTKEISNLLRMEIEGKKQRLQKVKHVYLSPRVNAATKIGFKEGDYFDIRGAKYSNCITVNSGKLQEWWRENVRLSCGSRNGDIFEVGKTLHNKVDLIVTDPPFSFDVAVGSPDELLKFYTNLICTFLHALKDIGQIIFCLPDETANGPSVPFYLTRPWLLREIFIQLAELYPEGRIIEISSTKPRYGSLLYSPPYYWRSKTAITRTVMHVLIQKSGHEIGDAPHAEKGGSP